MDGISELVCGLLVALLLVMANVAIAFQVAGFADPDDLLFEGARGAIMRSGSFRPAALTRAAERLGMCEDTGKVDSKGQSVMTKHLHPHELRYTAASLAIASGADLKVVQQMLGHKSATMTLDQYGHLFGDRLDVVADAVDAARTRELA